MKPLVRRVKPYLATRLEKVRQAMSQAKLDAFMVTHPPDLAYLTDFTGDDSIGLITRNSVCIVTDFRYQEQVQLESPWVKMVVRKGRMAEALADTLGRMHLRRIGFESNFTTCGQISSLEKAVRQAGRSIRLVPLEDVLVNIRKVKDQHEIDLIRKAVRIAEESFRAVRRKIRPGLTENQLAGMLISEMRSRGASKASFEPIIGAGPGSSLPHYRPGQVRVKKNQPLLFDWGALYEGYCSDLTRTLIVGRASRRIRHIYQVVLEAQAAAIDFLRPGVTTRQVDRLARDIIARAGFRQNFGHGLGHGVGRDIHEMPTLSQTGRDEPLAPGMVVTVEPGIYLPGEGGVRIEDDVLITAAGREVLSTLDKSFEGCHI